MRARETRYGGKILVVIAQVSGGVRRRLENSRKWWAQNLRCVDTPLKTGLSRTKVLRTPDSMIALGSECQP